jgi:predicted RNase H-like HicB family nuclease
MFMQAALNATEARANFGCFIDNVVRQKPQAIKRNRDVIVALSQEHLKDALSIYEFTIEFEQDEDNRYVGSIEQIPDIVGDGATLEELRITLAHHLMDYAIDFYADFNRYYSSPNRRSHTNYVLRVLLEDDFDTVLRMLHA